MSWWELRRLLITIAALDLAAGVVCAAACVVFSELNRETMGTALFAAAFAMAIGAVGFGGVRLPMASSASVSGSLYENQRLIEMEAEMGVAPPPSLLHEISRQGGTSWPLVFGFTAVTLLAASAVVIGAVG